MTCEKCSTVFTEALFGCPKCAAEELKAPTALESARKIIEVAERIEKLLQVIAVDVDRIERTIAMKHFRDSGQ